MVFAYTRFYINTTDIIRCIYIESCVGEHHLIFRNVTNDLWPIILYLDRFPLSNCFLSALSSPLLSVAVSREVSWPSFAGVGGVSGRVLPWRLELDVPRTCNKSKVWQHFGFTKKDGKFDKTHAICKICRAAIKYTGSTTNLGTPLKRRHVCLLGFS